MHGRGRPAAPLHPGLRERGARARDRRVEHVRYAAEPHLRDGGRPARRRPHGPLVPDLRRRAPEAPPPARLPDGPQQPEQPDVLDLGADRSAAAERHADAEPRQAVRADVRQLAVLLRATRLNGRVQERRLRQDMDPVPVLLEPVRQGVQPAGARQDHEGEPTGSALHRRLQQHRPTQRSARRLQHARGPAVGLRLRQQPRAAGLGDGDGHQGDVRPPTRLR